MENSSQLDHYRQTIRAHSDRLVEVQCPIRIFDAIKWDTDIQAAIFAQGCREIPAVNPAYYATCPLGFDPAESQPVCTFLGKGPPSSTVTQQGLAILMEIMALASYRGRLRRLANHVHAVAMAQDGASFLDVFHAYCSKGFSATQSYLDTTRVFRGNTPTGDPFTKDTSYSRGFVLAYNFIQTAVRKGMLRRILLLFRGKTTLEDIRTLALLVEEDIVVPPKYLPPQFADLSAMTAWMCYSNFLARLNLDQIEVDYANIF